ncbi:acyltransferase [Rhodococcus sp. NPDC058639]|uniref:acyltransferase n=1 Tax=Rhodococcus sp. NPDC058639 TaxID=3346570 RepID=UPI0036640C1C
MNNYGKSADLIAKALGKTGRLVGQSLWQRHLINKGVNVGLHVQIIGRPIVTVHSSSVIIIRDRAVLCSRSEYTALGIAKPVILRTLAAGASIEIGHNVGLSGTVICSASSVSIGDNCLIGADVTIADTDFHPISPATGRRNAPLPGARTEDRICIGSDVFIGAGTHVLKGVRIGSGAVVGTRSVVTRDIPPMTIAAGNPARPIGRVMQ